MSPTFVRPEHRQRSGSGPCAGADGPPEWLRSEAFAEDLVPGATPALPPRAAVPRAAAAPRPRSWRASFGLLIAAALGPRRAGAVD